MNVSVVYVELRSPTANGYGGVRLKGFLPDKHFFNEIIPGKKPKAATQRGFALPEGKVCEAWAWLTATQNSKGCASAAIARRVSIGSKTVFVCGHVYIRQGKTGRLRPG